MENDIALKVLPDGTWVATAGDRTFPLEETRDFFRVWQFLEQPFEEISSMLSEMTQNIESTIPFAFDKLIASALMFRNSNITNQAMEWVPFITDAQREPLLDLFREVANCKVGSQRARQIAQKYASPSIRALRTKHISGA
jgi:hypothetical protein